MSPSRSPAISTSSSARRTMSPSVLDAWPPLVRPRSRANSSPRSAASSPDEDRQPRAPPPRVRRRRRVAQPSDSRSCSERYGSDCEQRQLPAVERLAETLVVVESGAARGGRRQPAAELVQARRLARRLGGGDRQHRADAVRTPVEALEEHRARRDRSRRREPERGDRVRDLTGRVGRLDRAGREHAGELDDARPLRLLAEPGREQARSPPASRRRSRRRPPGATQMCGRGRP